MVMRDVQMGLQKERVIILVIKSDKIIKAEK